MLSYSKISLTEKAGYTGNLRLQSKLKTGNNDKRLRQLYLDGNSFATSHSKTFLETPATCNFSKEKLHLAEAVPVL